MRVYISYKKIQYFMILLCYFSQLLIYQGFLKTTWIFVLSYAQMFLSLVMRMSRLLVSASLTRSSGFYLYA